MDPTLTNIVIAFLIVNAIFWGLFPHTAHCKFVANFGITECPQHWVHLLTGLIAYLSAVWLKNSTYIKRLL